MKLMHQFFRTLARMPVTTANVLHVRTVVETVSRLTDEYMAHYEALEARFHELNRDFESVETESVQLEHDLERLEKLTAKYRLKPPSNATWTRLKKKLEQLRARSNTIRVRTAEFKAAFAAIY